MSKRGGKASRRRQRRLKNATQDTFPEPAPKKEELTETPDFSNLPEAVVVNVLLKSSLDDVLCLSCCCRAFRKTMESESFWQQYCHSNWSHKTSPSKWLQESHPVTHIPNLPRPTDYKSLGMLLAQMDSFIGLWLGSDHRPQGLFEFVWMEDCIACCNLMTSSDDDVLYIGPRYSIAGEVVDGSHCVLRDYGLSALPSGCSTTAAAVASVAVGSVSDSSLSTSFETEMMLYMQTSVRSKRNRTHRRGQGSGVVVPYMHLFTRLSVPSASKHTWMTRLWTRAVNGKTLSEVILLEHDYSGNKAQIVAKWASGARAHRYGAEAWRVSARAMTSWMGEGRLLKGIGHVWDQEVEREVAVCGFLVISSNDCISLCWSLDGAPQPANRITYRRLRGHR